MWRDELQIFQLGTNSRTLVDLSNNLRYQGHPALWDVLVWGVAHLTPNPAWMQVLHAATAVPIWLLVYRWSPFTRLEKLLLLLSYFLFFEYFVVTRPYALATLCGFGYVALRQHLRAHTALAWLLLGLQANVATHATIASIAFALVFVLEERRHDARFLGGVALYLALLAFSIASMIPAPDFGPWDVAPRFELSGAIIPLMVMLGAFVPVDPDWFRAAAAFLSDPQTTPVPFVWNPNPAQYILGLAHPGAEQSLLLAASLLIVPIALCVFLTRNRYRVLEFSLAYVGICLFAALWHFPGGARHHGLVFIALVASVWTARAGASGRTSWLLVALLAINAFGGVITLGSEFNTFSQSRNAARWIETNNLAEMPLIGSRDAQVSSAGGYLGRPIYYLECECTGTFIVWNGRRQSPLSLAQFRERLADAVVRISAGDALLILNRPLAPPDFDAARFTVIWLESFVGSVTQENYWLYRVVKTAS